MEPQRSIHFFFWGFVEIYDILDPVLRRHIVYSGVPAVDAKFFNGCV